VAIDDYYVLLGLEYDADIDDVRRAWKRTAHRYHPDVAGPDATFVFQKIAEAYAVLADPQLRAAYDRERGIKQPSRFEAASSEPASSEPAPPPRRAPGILIRRLSSPLNILVASGIANIADDGVIDLHVEPHEVEEGGMVTIAMRVPIGDREELFAAWLALRPGVADGTILHPSALLPGMKPVQFRVRRPSA
jgi:curved DNA-binding protein CbpA